jgi:diphosphomevalonate decarboxylase
MTATTETTTTVTVWAPINIALLKYWGKRDQSLILPVNDSISLTLQAVHGSFGTTSVLQVRQLPPGETVDQIAFNLNGAFHPASIEMARKVVAAFKIFNGLADVAYAIHVDSNNEFPTQAGLASSASGFAALSFGIHHALGLGNRAEQMCITARMGSGSATRSLHGGFVQWDRGTKADGSDSISRQLHDEAWWPELRCLICIVDPTEKKVLSRAGMERTRTTSQLFAAVREDEALMAQKAADFRDAIDRRDFARLAELAMRESNQLHALCMDSYPPIVYHNDTSKEIMAALHRLNELEGRTVAGYTFDAGPNAFVLVLEQDMDVLKRYLKEMVANPIQEMVECRVGGGPRLISCATVSIQQH